MLFVVDFCRRMKAEEGGCPLPLEQPIQTRGGPSAPDTLLPGMTCAPLRQGGGPSICENAWFRVFVGAGGLIPLSASAITRVKYAGFHRIGNALTESQSRIRTYSKTTKQRGFAVLGQVLKALEHFPMIGMRSISGCGQGGSRSAIVRSAQPAVFASAKPLRHGSMKASSVSLPDFVDTHPEHSFDPIQSQ